MSLASTRVSVDFRLPIRGGMSREVPKCAAMSGAQEAHPGRREINGDIGKQIGKY